MFRAILLQVIVTLIVVTVAGLVVGIRGAVSAFLGGAACIIPNALFALRLRAVANRRGASYPLNFFVGELAKVLLTIAFLFLAARIYADLHWPSMLIGLGLALQAMFLAFWKTK